jgi:hypothetical protein
MKHLLLSAIAMATCILSSAQAVLDPPAKTIKLEKAQVTFLAIAPKGDRILVGTDKGADLMDLTTGKRVYHFAFMEDNSTIVYDAMFNENGEYLMLAGFTGKRKVFDLKTGKQEGNLALFKWLPNSLAMKAIGLKMGNTTFDRYYEQEGATHGDITAKADKDGVVVFTNKEGAALQTLKYPENKDQHYRAPCVFTDAEFITGTDDGRVLFYTLR